MEKEIAVLGAVFQDILTLSRRLPKKGETVQGGSIHINSGGKGANQAVQCARLGLPTCMITQIGRDVQGEAVKAAMLKDGINCAYVFVTEKMHTGSAVIFADEDGNNMIVTAPGASGVLGVEEVNKAVDVIRNAALFVTQLEIEKEAVLCGLKIANESGVPTILNPAPASFLPDEIYQYVNYITPNETEAEFYTGILRSDWDTPEWASKTADWFLEKGVGHVCITMGEKGVFFADCEQRFFVPAFSITAVDTTAAGDSFHGGFIYGLVNGLDVKKCCQIGNACGALTSASKGAQSSIPQKEAVFRFLQEKGIKDCF